MEIAGIGFRCPSTPRESVRRGLDTEARRSGLPTTSSFDEAAVEADLVLFPGRARQRASAAGTRPSPWPNTPRGGSAARRALDRELTGPGGAGSKRTRGTSRARPKLGARRQAGLYPRSRRSSGFGLSSGRGSRPPGRKPKGKVIRESSDPEGARIVGRLQKLGRRIFPGRAKRTERWVEPRQGSLTRRLVPDEAGRFVAGERVRGERVQANSERVQAWFRTQGLTSSQRKASRFWVAEALNKPRERRA